jgi:retinol dehydrogenase-13
MKTAAVTGASGAIGQAIAQGLAEAGFEVVLIVRDERRGRAALEDIRRNVRDATLRLEVVDLSLLSSIRRLAGAWSGPLHVLVNNASATPRRREVTVEGLEAQFATNIMGYFWMTQELTRALERSAPSRVVNVASYWAGDLALDDLQFARRRYDNNMAYRQSKQAERMLTAAFAERLHARGITVNACHPGDVNSRLSNSLGFGGHETPEQGAATPLELATSPELEGIRGRYFEHGRETHCRFAADRQAVEALYAACAAVDAQRR